MSVVTNIGKNTGHCSPASRSVPSKLKCVTSIQENPFSTADQALEYISGPTTDTSLRRLFMVLT